MFLLSFPLSPDFPGYFGFVPGLLHLWRSGLLQWLKMLEIVERFELQWGHLLSGVITCRLACLHKRVASFHSSGRGWSVQHSLRLLEWPHGLLPPVRGRLQRGLEVCDERNDVVVGAPQPRHIGVPWKIMRPETLAGGGNDKLEFCKHFSKMIFCDPGWLACILYERSMTSS